MMELTIIGISGVSTVNLTPLEWRLYEFLSYDPYTVFKREYVYEAVWEMTNGWKPKTWSACLSVLTRRLQKKLQAHGLDQPVGVHGHGICLRRESYARQAS